ncbi:protein-export membrane protein SecF [Acidimicrobium ferrooxidans DSM 10331]|uniref:Protein-export membrane protein SecF n=1 Tax=Acidimicrobium ferrooxidans (strain DSM 10331 / JCM 15462 / NBRC 103882 / ICP) TaxID=525909 RepID=C7LYS7_ACIFD|nr:protein translocase subunit SecF [Acidimicrobium ferrooxidans]ACU53885.1 protein-export membrane protein SecF [Acidimicrobium ferrooxidans DSM 10331]
MSQVRIVEDASQLSWWRRVGAGATRIRFVERARWFWAVSLVVIAVGAAALGIRGLNFGIDFRGGLAWQVSAPTLSVTQARSALAGLPLSGTTVVSLGTGQHRTIEVEADLPTSGARAHALENEVAARLAAAAHQPSSAVAINYVGPTWGSQITDASLKALVAFFVGITLYISLRFEWKMALAALIAVIHDLVVTVGIYALSGFQITPSTVIAVLTVLGYSLYDTIVIFDRIKENVATHVDQAGEMTYSEVVDRSVNQMLARSINTSVVAVIPILSVLVVGAYLLGATTLRNFGLALVVGLTSGAYSSIAIASPILAFLKEREPRYRQLKRRIAARRIAPATEAAGTIDT